ncbi:hypothetical protein L2E82_33976 [Cichorium intybus]|uniref:Uncharacterized protein n=1 Tax=Cichorium intybus TaxID=13427 RepID=A0ACB9BLG2_CICIN|nr:hypothetical protein L2E82_33976 [Cichorium intybus]
MDGNLVNYCSSPLSNWFENHSIKPRSPPSFSVSFLPALSRITPMRENEGHGRGTMRDTRKKERHGTAMSLTITKLQNSKIPVRGLLGNNHLVRVFFCLDFSPSIEWAK